MLLKYNIRNIKRDRRMIDIVGYDVKSNTNYHTLTIKTKTPHKLKQNDIILLKKEIINVDYYTDAVSFLERNPSDIVFVKKIQTITEKNIKQEDNDVTYGSGYYWKENNKIVKISEVILSDILAKYSSFNDKIEVLSVNNEFEFVIKIKRYQELYVNNITDMDDIGLFRVTGNLPLLLHKGDKFTVLRKTYYYNFIRISEQYDSFKEVFENPQDLTTYLGNDMAIFAGNVYEWISNTVDIPCTYINEKTFSYLYSDGIVNNNEILEVEDTRFISKTQELQTGVVFYEYQEYIGINLPVSGNFANELNDENLAKTYFNERKEELITKISDYEKRCFIPYYKSLTRELKPVNLLTFNVFLRDRSGSEDWNTNDAKGWNQHYLNDDGSFTTNEEITNGDLLAFLGFSDNDIYYRKKKVEKSFLRLSFYSSNDPLTQMLLFYSTIFLDSGELYTKYIYNLNDTRRDSSIPITAQSNFGSNNLTLSFSATDRYNRNKSSEGFYLYLFPDGLQNNTKRTIYMKAEFNHAGNGKTVPLIFPHDLLPLTFKNKKFPSSLLTDDGDLSELYRQMFIPLTIEYDATKNEYMYYFNIATYNNDNQEIIMGLYEPKINPLE